MHFKKLELIGFKSFADKTVLHFEPGVTAVVGPNGCGKSNIFDSIRWVLGEQSVKAMRGSSMEDVIFNGTVSKPPLGFAEVSLTFSNEGKLLPIDYEEVTITRRLFRSGESEYLINKSQVRLKDINELLMGTGIASEAYSLVEQGKIDLVLSSRPEERRSIFDEAAGITKYKSKKKEALNKLKDTEENLLRLSDIIDEVKRQIGSVERQAAKARRYQEQFERLKSQEIKMALHELAEFGGQMKNLAAERDASKIKIKELELEISSSLREFGELQSESDEITSDIEVVDRDVLKSDAIVERFCDQIKVSNERIDEYRKRSDDLTREKGLIAKRIDEEEGRLQSLNQELSSYDSVAQEKQAQLKIKNISLEKIAQDSDSARKIISESKKAILEVTSQLTISRNDAQKINNDLTTLSARRRRLELESAKVGEEKQGADANFKEKNAYFQQAQFQVNSLKSGLDKEKNDLYGKQKAYREIETHISELEKELLSLESNKEFLINLKTKYSDIHESSKAEFFLDAQDLKAAMIFLGKIESISDSEDSSKSLKRLTCHIKVIDLDLEKLSRREAEISALIQVEKNKKQDLEKGIESCLGSVAAGEKQLRELEISLSNITTQVNIIGEDVKKFEEELSIVSEELGEVKQEAGVLEKTFEEARLKTESLESEIKRLEHAISGNQDLISKLNGERETTVVEITQLQTSFASMADNRVSLGNSVKIVESSLAQDRIKLDGSDRQIEDCKQRIEQLLAQIGQLEKDIENARKSKETGLAHLEKLKTERDIFSQRIRDKQSKVNEANANLDLARQADFDISSKEQEINYKILNLKNRMDSTYHINLDSPEHICASLGEEELNILQEELRVLRDKLDSYGAVNLVAIEEFEELKKRFEFLTNQQNDLITAKESIHQAIAKINQTTRKMFVQTFEKIQENFKAYFRLLFNGGDAQLFLIDENDVLESGIEIVCRPPGKKLQNISLLSGGEKSLSAIALVFSVFKVKPSPFCVLDEIDAALDESNIDRYNRVLQEFLKTTQFIIITHNKKTITNADVMYGITMQESGVSKVVSVKFAKDKTGKPVKEKEAPVLEQN